MQGGLNVDVMDWRGLSVVLTYLARQLHTLTHNLREKWVVLLFVIKSVMTSELAHIHL